MRITVAGVGYVGLSLSVMLAQKHEVTAITTTPSKADKLNRLESTIKDSEIDACFHDAKCGKITNVISKESDLISCDLNKNINIFKLNGDIRDIQNAVITKNDLEKYPDYHNYYLAFFKRELITKTFLFLGYSFTD